MSYQNRKSVNESVCLVDYAWHEKKINLTEWQWYYMTTIKI